MDAFRLDLSYAVRMLLKNPGFAAVALLTLALGSGVNTAMFTVVSGVLLRPLPYADPERLVALLGQDAERGFLTLSPLDFGDLATDSKVFQGAAAIQKSALSLTGRGEPERVVAAAVSWNFFELLGVEPALGRSFHRSEGRAGNEGVALLGDGLWRRRFGADPSAVGATIRLDGRVFTVIGIAPPATDFPTHVELWIPLVLRPEQLDPSQRGAHYLTAVGRLKRGVELAAAQAAVGAVARRLERAYPDSNTGVGAIVIPLRDLMVQKARPALLVLLGAVGLVLLIACANVTSLLLARAVSRQGELAIRAALGAAKLRLIRQHLTEGLLLAGLGGGLGLLLAVWITDLVVAWGPADLPRLAQVAIDARVLAFALGAVLLTTVLVGLLPALQSGAADLHQRLQAGGRATLGGGRRIRNLLVVGEMALALLLLAGAGLLIRSFAALQQVAPGFDPRRILTFELWLPEPQYAELERSAAFYQQLTDRLAALPGVEAAAGVFGLPLSGGPSAYGSFEIPGRPEREGYETSAGVRVVTPDYFRALRIPLLEGRPFDRRDAAATQPVVILNHAAARRYWPGRSPIGERLRCQISMVERREQPRTIVGVVGDVHFDGLDRPAGPEIFLPHAQHPVTIMSLTVRTRSDPRALTASAREAVRALDPGVPLADVSSMEQVLEGSIAQRRFSMLLLAIFAALAVLLAAVGMHGVLSYAVAQRTSELGLRMALGAQPRAVFGMVLGQGLMLAGAGAALGLAGALALTRLLESLLYGVSATDAATLSAVLLGLAAIALLAGLLPARRAARIDPSIALRCE